MTNTTEEVTDEMIQRGAEIAEEIFDDVFEREEDNYEPGTVIFSLFVNSIHVLHAMGWTTQELVNEVFNHADCETSAGEIIQ